MSCAELDRVVSRSAEAAATSTGDGPDPIGAAREQAPRGFVRSRQMADCLRTTLLYSEKRPRDALFRILGQLLKEQERIGPPMILSRLTREAARRARYRAERVGFEFHHWDTTAKAVINAMLCAGVLVGTDGVPIPPGITAQATPVGGLVDRYEDLTEAFLLETLVRRLGDVTTRDHRSLAHALFRQFDRDVSLEDLEDRVVILLAQLADRVELHDDRYVARAS
jgi:hypothetical protein